MTIEEVVRKVLLHEHADVVREARQGDGAEPMEIRVSEAVEQAGPLKAPFAAMLEDAEPDRTRPSTLAAFALPALLRGRAS